MDEEVQNLNTGMFETRICSRGLTAHKRGSGDYLLQMPSLF